MPGRDAAPSLDRFVEAQAAIYGPDSPFTRAIDLYFDGDRDEKTLALLDPGV